jgi:hypothetical protein
MMLMDYRKGSTEWAWEFGMKDSKQVLMKETNQAWESHCLSLREQSIGFSYDLDHEE